MINPHVHGLTRHVEIDVADHLPCHLGVRCVPVRVQLQVYGQFVRMLCLLSDTIDVQRGSTRRLHDEGHLTE